MIGVIDYGMGNLGSVLNACHFLQRDVQLLSAPEQAENCRALILPGVGAFGDCMLNLRKSGFAELVTRWVEQERPLLGICVGLQVLFEGSDETPDVPGLGLFAGRIRRFDLRPPFKIPQMGWNQLHLRMPECPLFREVPENSFCYFVHSYYADPEDQALVAAQTDYGQLYASAIWRGSLMATQFHPEKSHQIGLKMLDNYFAWVESL